MLDHKDDPLETRNRLARAMFAAWWFPFSRFGVIHGDPHLGNYTVRDRDAKDGGRINLLDFGAIRVFPPKFVGGVIDPVVFSSGPVTTALWTREPCPRVRSTFSPAS